MIEYQEQLLVEALSLSPPSPGTLPDFCCVAHLLMVHTLTFRHPTYNTLFHGLISTDRMQRVPDKLIVPYKTVWVVRTWTRGGWGVRVQRQVWLHGGNKNKQTNLETVKVKKVAKTSIWFCSGSIGNQISIFLIVFITPDRQNLFALKDPISISKCSVSSDIMKVEDPHGEFN